MPKLISLFAMFCIVLYTVSFAEDNEIAITWWGCMSVEVNIGEINFVFDPYIEPSEPRFHYIFISHDHYDHCHEPTLRKLITPHSPLQMLFASRGSFYASRLFGPNNWTDTLGSDLSFVPREKAVAMFPKYHDRVGGSLHRDARAASYHGPTEIVLGGRFRVEAFRSHEDPRPADRYMGKEKDKAHFVELRGFWPNVGYIVTDMETGFSFAHTGDIWHSYPEMELMRGKVDVLFYPFSKLNLQEKTKMMEYIRPRIAIPTHYRLFEPDFPIPPLYLEYMTEEEVRQNLRAACLGNWYPTPADPVSKIGENRDAFEGITRVVELKAGVRYVLPEDLDDFTGRERE